MRRLLLLIPLAVLVACNGTPTPSAPTATPDEVDLLATRIWSIGATLPGLHDAMGDAGNIERVSAGISQGNVTGITLCYNAYHNEWLAVAFIEAGEAYHNVGRGASAQQALNRLYREMGW